MNSIVKGFIYFILVLFAVWLAGGFWSFLVDMWPVIKYTILVGAGLYLFHNLSKAKMAKKRVIEVDPNGNAQAKEV